MNEGQFQKESGKYSCYELRDRRIKTIIYWEVEENNMSLISVVGCNRFISVMSDGRLSGKDSQENFNKIKNFENKIFLSMWGNKIIFDDLSRIFDDTASKIKSDAYVDSLSIVIDFAAANNNYAIYMPFIILWGGINKGKLKMCQLRSNPTKIQEIVLDSSDFICGTATDKDYAFGYLDSAMNKVLVPNLENVQKIQKETNFHVSEMDNTVNNNTFTCVIKSP
jgi:hypothetical protein